MEDQNDIFENYRHLTQRNLCDGPITYGMVSVLQLYRPKLQCFHSTLTIVTVKDFMILLGK